ncbi:MAG: c-type cytochrome [Herminiimonas sp.]|nr:c-type cytochrome [Herminiimonas sp.]
MSKYRPFPSLSKIVGILGPVLVIVSANGASAQTLPPRAAAVPGADQQNAAACTSCHGSKGEGNGLAGFPRLAGLSMPYLQRQLMAFASGERQNAVMQPIAKALTAPQQAALASYFSRLPSPLPGTVSDAVDIKSTDVGAWLAERGRWENGLPACVECHAQGGVGVGTAFPPLAGQPVTYIENQLHAFKRKTRSGGPMNLMGVVASKLSETDITAVANYYGEIKTPAVATPEKKVSK